MSMRSARGLLVVLKETHRMTIDACLTLWQSKTAVLVLAMSVILADLGTSDAQVPSLPDVGRPFEGDPRLEPIP